MSLSDQIQKQAQHLAKNQSSVGTIQGHYNYPREEVPSVKEPSVRDMLTARLEEAERRCAMTRSLLDELPVVLLEAPCSFWHSFF